MAKQISQDEAQKALFALVQEEITRNEKEQFWITDKVAFNMREMIKEARKNYWGVYDEPYDQITGEEKVWVPATRMLVDAVRKNVDLDPKDVRFRSVDPKRTGLTHLVRGYTRKLLSAIYFNHTLNQTIFQTSMDGTAVWKTYTDEKGNIVRKDVDILNVYIDPTADSIQETPIFTELIVTGKQSD